MRDHSWKKEKEKYIRDGKNEKEKKMSTIHEKKSIMSVKKSKSHIKRGNVIYRILCEYLHII